MKLINFDKMESTASVWMIEGELGIHYPGPNGGFCQYFDNYDNKWSATPWTGNELYIYSEHPGIEFISWIE